MRRARLLLAFAFAIGLTACGGDAPGDGASGIRGRALAGPQCPVEVAGSPCPDAPWEGTVVAIDAASGDRHSVETDADGRFELALAPGTYEITIDVESSPPFAKPQSVSVEAGAFTDVTVAVDTGIR